MLSVMVVVVPEVLEHSVDVSDSGGLQGIEPVEDGLVRSFNFALISRVVERSWGHEDTEFGHRDIDGTDHAETLESKCAGIIAEDLAGLAAFSDRCCQCGQGDGVGFSVR